MTEPSQDGDDTEDDEDDYDADDENYSTRMLMGPVVMVMLLAVMTELMPCKLLLLT